MKEQVKELVELMKKKDLHCFCCGGDYCVEDSEFDTMESIATAILDSLEVDEEKIAKTYHDTWYKWYGDDIDDDSCREVAKAIHNAKPIRIRTDTLTKKERIIHE